MDLNYKKLSTTKVDKDSNILRNLSSSYNVPVDVCRNMTEFFKKEYSVPFICRYRGEAVGSVKPEKVYKMQASYKEMKQVEKKVERILKKEIVDKDLISALLSAKTVKELEFLSVFKSTSMKNLLSKVNESTLNEIAEKLLRCETTFSKINFSAIAEKEKGFKSVGEVQYAVQYIISNKISKDKEILNFLQKTMDNPEIRISSVKSGLVKIEDLEANEKLRSTYDCYYNFNKFLKDVAHYQVMAINRGEKQNILKVKIEIPKNVKKDIMNFIWSRFFQRKLDYQTHKFLERCVKNSFNQVIEPLLHKQIRVDLTRKAQTECISVFCSNVRNLLLTPPLRGKAVIGIDPGFLHGCKVAVVSSNGEVLKTDVIYPHTHDSKIGFGLFNAQKLKHMVSKFGVDVIGIGNGIACRETELWISESIRNDFFQPFDVKYCIVDEAGVSFYSVSPEAEAEFPNMNPKIRSAVAIAKRLQDPLLEYSKIDPKHMGVGMYQHDVPEDELSEALDNIVEECVCSVGVDLNVCPEFLLRKISGLNSILAKNIVNFRRKHGSFLNRQQLLDIEGFDNKVFEQCAGFLKILPETCLPECSRKTLKKMKKMLNPLDRTIIHPESYKIAERFLIKLHASPEEIGTETLIAKLNKYMTFTCAEDVAKSLDVSVPVVQLIIDAFKQLPGIDIRGAFEPFYSTTIRKYSDLKSGQILIGKVVCFTEFGAFVDIGTSKHGLIYDCRKSNEILKIGEKVRVKVLRVEKNRKRIDLELL